MAYLALLVETNNELSRTPVGGGAKKSDEDA
jgi:hypothetical protein